MLKRKLCIQFIGKSRVFSFNKQIISIQVRTYVKLFLKFIPCELASLKLYFQPILFYIIEFLNLLNLYPILYWNQYESLHIILWYYFNISNVYTFNIYLLYSVSSVMRNVHCGLQDVFDNTVMNYGLNQTFQKIQSST